jgi:guanine nucleotide-binding protein subunit alpha
MGCGGSKEDTSARDRSDAIEAQLKKDRLAMRSEIKMCVGLPPFSWAAPVEA